MKFMPENQNIEYKTAFRALEKLVQLNILRKEGKKKRGLFIN